jgi:starvation-inducible DNA-binding protein
LKEVMMATTLREPIPMRAMRNDLTADICAGAVTSLNQRLADAIDLQLQAKHAHWNVKGPSFFALHQLFERVAVAVAGHADLIAERAVQLGGVAEGAVQAVAQRSELSPYPLRIEAGVDHVRALAGSLATFAAKMRCSIAEAEREVDPVSVDILTEVSRDIEKLLWLVEAHAQTPR